MIVTGMIQTAFLCCAVCGGRGCHSRQESTKTSTDMLVLSWGHSDASQMLQRAALAVTGPHD